jgi:hypothetical protein
MVFRRNSTPYDKFIYLIESKLIPLANIYMTAHFPGLLQALHIHDRSISLACYRHFIYMTALFPGLLQHFIYMTAHFPGLLQALHIHDHSFPWLATGK